MQYSNESHGGCCTITYHLESHKRPHPSVIFPEVIDCLSHNSSSTSNSERMPTSSLQYDACISKSPVEIAKSPLLDSSTLLILSY